MEAGRLRALQGVQYVHIFHDTQSIVEEEYWKGGWETCPEVNTIGDGRLSTKVLEGAVE